MNKKEGKAIATVKVFLNTGLIAILVATGFLLSTLLFGVILLIVR